MLVDEEQMLDIAENCFIKIGDHLLSKNVSVKEAFNEFIQTEEIND